MMEDGPGKDEFRSNAKRFLAAAEDELKKAKEVEVDHPYNNKLIVATEEVLAETTALLEKDAGDKEIEKDAESEGGRD